MVASRRDEVGKRYGKLTVVAYLRSGGDRQGAVWGTVCDCGRTREVLIKRLRAGEIRTCGDCTSPTKHRVAVPGITPGKKKEYIKLLRQAIPKGGAKLSAQEYLHFMDKKPCSICNAGVAKGEWAEPDAPHAVTNLVALCDLCSYHRRGRSLALTLGWLQKVYQRVQQTYMSEFR